MAIVTYSSLGKMGRFGNQAFQIMSTIGIARNNGMDFRFPKWINHDHKDRFGSTEDIDIYKHLANPLPEWTGEAYIYRWINWGYEDVTLYGNTDLQGHMQSDKYFRADMEEVRHYMTFKNEPEPLPYVAVHWRAGDYEEGGRSVYHPRMDRGYYRQAMEHFPAEAVYLIFSDDVVRAKEMFAGVNCIFSTGNYIQDFEIMKQCQSFICANSSFSMAAAILANQPGKKIVCPRLWFGDPAGGLQMDYPEGAIVI
ncbi:MAG: alpha-1,2-fucosyltransferase [Taibaiella sp.]|nr:alpha-1,2-fucosyltransferase [Taibaiella sp.]